MTSAASSQAATAGNRVQSVAGRGIRKRMAVVCGFLALGLGIVVSSGYTLQVTDGKSWRELAEKQRQRRLHVTPKRGSLYDRNGAALAVSVEVPSVSLDAVELLRGVAPRDVPAKAREAANRLGAALDLDPTRIERRILKKRRFTWLKRRISSEEAERIRQLTAIDAASGPLRGVRIDGEGHRYYPKRELAASLLGFVATDGDGKDGLELGLNEELAGRVEWLPGLRDRSGRLLFAEAVEDDQALAGHNVYLSIDEGIQYIAERELASAARTYEAVGGSVVVVDPESGEILAIASWPGYNPNDYRQSDVGARRGRAVADVFEPGSSMKIFTVGLGLEAGVIQPTESLYCENGRMPVDNVVIRDTHPAEWLNITQVLAVSSNVCAAKIGLALGGQNLYQGLRRFGFGRPTEVPLPGDAAGVLLPRGRAWVQVETAAASFGQGVSVTNLQLAMATAAIANGGNLLEPILIKRVTTATGEVVREAVPRVRQRAVSERSARVVAEMMVAVTEGEGTGVQATIAGFSVAGKTATAQKTEPETGRYSIDKYTASFVGFVPARQPKLAISIVLDEPVIEHAGGAVAAPMFRRIAEASLKYLGVIPRGTKAPDFEHLATGADPAQATYAVLRQALGSQAPVQDVVVRGRVGPLQVRVPNMTGWPVRRALTQSFQLGLQPSVQGSGVLVRQEPAPGSVVDKQAPLKLVFEPAS